MTLTVSGEFAQIAPDVVPGQSGFYGPGAIMLDSGFYYVRADDWQLVPLAWQWTMRGGHFDLDLEDIQTSGISLGVKSGDLTVSYLGWPIAHGDIATSVPEASSAVYVAVALVLGFVMMRRRP